jgi:uncharacterized protein YbaA (DUF1428 family)
LAGDLASDVIADSVLQQLAPAVDLHVVHVLTSDSMPMLDRPMRDLELWSKEFGARHCPEAAAVHWRAGSVATEVRAAVAELGADLVVVSWSQDLGSNRADVVREMLANASVPVMLVPKPASAVEERRLAYG